MIEELNKIEEHLRMASIHLGQANEIFDVLMDFITGAVKLRPQGV